jgi:hypothetical protein
MGDIMAIDLSRGKSVQAYLQEKPGEFHAVTAIEPPQPKIAPDETDTELPTVTDEPFPRTLWQKLRGKQPPARVRDLEQQENLNWKDKRKLNKKADRSFLITMRFSNGTRRTWVILSRGDFFTYRKQMYYLMYENAYYDLTNHCYHLDFFDDHVVPIDRKILLIPDKSAVQGKETAFFAVNPANVKPIIKMEYVKALADSQSLSKYMKFLVIVNMAAVLISAVGIYLVNSIPKKMAPLVAQLVINAIKAGAIKP